jgi:hypothetical protein
MSKSSAAIATKLLQLRPYKAILVHASQPRDPANRIEGHCLQKTTPIQKKSKKNIRRKNCKFLKKKFFRWIQTNINRADSMFAYRDSIFFTYFNIGTLFLSLLWIDNWLAFLLAMSHAAVSGSRQVRAALSLLSHTLYSPTQTTPLSPSLFNMKPT